MTSQEFKLPVSASTLYRRAIKNGKESDHGPFKDAPNDIKTKYVEMQAKKSKVMRLKRPKTAYNLFTSENMKKVLRSLGSSYPASRKLTDAMRKNAKDWKELTSSEKAHWEALAKKEKVKMGFTPKPKGNYSGYTFFLHEKKTSSADGGNLLWAKLSDSEKQKWSEKAKKESASEGRVATSPTTRGRSPAKSPKKSPKARKPRVKKSSSKSPAKKTPTKKTPTKKTPTKKTPTKKTPTKKTSPKKVNKPRATSPSVGKSPAKTKTPTKSPMKPKKSPAKGKKTSTKVGGVEVDVVVTPIKPKAKPKARK